MELSEIPKNPEKEIFTVKHDGKYFAVITGDISIYVSPKEFDSPLAASNHARTLKRQNKIVVNIKKQEKSSTAKNAATIAKKNKFYTEAEMASQTKLSFREIWLIVSPEGLYASNILTDNKVVKYEKDKDKAQMFKTYEDAYINLNTLNMVICCGHKLRRFFKRIEN